MLPDWTTRLLQEPTQLQTRGYQSYVVLSLSRVLYTLHFGRIASKLAAARWVQESLSEQWEPLVERALAGRHDPGSEATAEDIDGTLAFIRYTQERSQQAALLR